MSLSKVIEFQNYLHLALEQNAELNSQVYGIYQTLQSKTKYPFIFHQIISIEELQNPCELYEVKGEINIFLRNNDIKKISKIIYEIEKIFDRKINALHSYKYISGKINDITFSKSKDQLTTTAKLVYTSLIQKI